MFFSPLGYQRADSYRYHESLSSNIAKCSRTGVKLKLVSNNFFIAYTVEKNLTTVRGKKSFEFKQIELIQNRYLISRQNQKLQQTFKYITTTFNDIKRVCSIQRTLTLHRTLLRHQRINNKNLQV